MNEFGTARARTAIALCMLASIATARQNPTPEYKPDVKPASDETKLAVDALKLPKGLTAKLWAAEPMLANPVCLWITDTGDIYVAETFRHYAGVTDMRDHMDWLDEELAAKSVEDRVAMLKKHAGNDFAFYTKDSDRIRLLRDTNHGGVANSDVVFADGFNDAAAGIGAGLLEDHGNVYFTNIPDLWLLRDDDHNGRADVRKSLSHGYGVHVAYLGHDLHGLRIGPDQKLYFSSGDRGLRVETPQGLVDNPDCGAVLRCNLDGSELEVFATGLRNPQELVFDEYGNLWTGDNNSDGGDEARLVYVVEGGDSGWRFHYQHLTDPWVRGPWNDELLWKPHFDGQAAYIAPPVDDVAHGPSGITYEPGTALSAEWRKHFFLVDFEGDPKYSGVLSFQVEPSGASFKLKGDVKQTIWNNCATDVDFGPDGALYFCDWVTGWQKTGKGRIFKIDADAGKDALARKETQSLLAADLSKKSQIELGALLANPDQRVRQKVEFELVARGNEGFEMFASLIHGTVSQFARLHAIWGLGILARKDRRALDEIRPLLSDEDAEVRAQTAKVLGDAHDKDSWTKLAPLLKDESPRVRYFAALALGKFGTHDVVGDLFELASSTGEKDPVIRHAACFALANCATEAELAGMANDKSVDARIAAIVALRRKKSASIAKFVADGEPRVATEAARAIYDLDLKDALPALADRIDDAKISGNALVRRVLYANFRVGGEARAQKLAAFGFDDSRDEKLRLEALDLVVHWTDKVGRDALTGAWRPLEKRDGDRAFVGKLAKSLETRAAAAPPKIAASWIELVRTLKVAECAPTITTWANDATKSPKLRAAALGAIAALAPKNAADTLRAAIADGDGEVRSAAIGGLQKVAPGEVLPILKQALAGTDPRELRTAYYGLGKLADSESIELLSAELDKLANGLVSPEVALDLVSACESKSDKLDEKLRARSKGREAADKSLAEWLDCLYGGDVELGRHLFHDKVELTCIKCHKIEENGEGGIVGPLLKGVAQRHTRLSLLESIVEPNRKIARGYDATQFITKDEKIVEGRVLSEAKDVIRLIDSEGKTIELPTADVESRKPGLSAMPAGLAQHLSKHEMRDLIAYLATL